MKIKSFLLLLVLYFVGFVDAYPQSESQYSVMFYNVENLFDTTDDPETNDEEFTPEGERHWTFNRYTQKILNLSKVILNASGWNPPEMIGLCEIENKEVLEKLLQNTPLKSYPYKIIHKQSPDSRGIDVAFLYNKKQFYPLEYKYYPIFTSSGEIIKTREILYVCGIVNKSDTLHLFFNHWPSRYSGVLETNSLRILAAKELYNLVEELFQRFINPNIIIMGDFNDQPSDESIKKYLVDEKDSNVVSPERLYNLSEDWINKIPGTIKYRTQWSVFDQIIVSGQLLKRDGRIQTGKDLATIVKLPFLIEPDERYGGERPNRSYIGFDYHGGFSDHLPVILQLKTAN